MDEKKKEKNCWNSAFLEIGPWGESPVASLSTVLCSKLSKIFANGARLENPVEYFVERYCSRSVRKYPGKSPSRRWLSRLGRGNYPRSSRSLSGRFTRVHAPRISRYNGSIAINVAERYYAATIDQRRTTGYWYRDVEVGGPGETLSETVSRAHDPNFVIPSIVNRNPLTWRGYLAQPNARRFRRKFFASPSFAFLLFSFFSHRSFHARSFLLVIDHRDK